MTPCARGCCWVPMEGVCAQQRKCACHWVDVPRTEPRTSDARTYRNPTEDEAIRRVMAARRNPKRPRT